MSIPEQNPQSQTASEQKNDKEYNFSQLRKQLEQERQARQEAEARAMHLEQQRQTQQNDNDDDDNEPYVDKKTLKKTLSKWEQNLDQRIDKKAEEKARSLVEQERQNHFLRANPDFNQILTPELVSKFAEKHPEIAEPMLEMPENFARQKLLYQNIKALGLHKPPEAPKANIQDTIDKNRRSPYYQPSGASSPPYANAGDYSDTGQQNAYKKMQELIKNRKS